MKLMNGGTVDFNLAMTAASGGSGPIGFSIDPFTTAQFQENNTKLKINGGFLLDGDTWFPGGGATNGQLWINVTSGGEGDFGHFTLKERPLGGVIPGPSALLAMGGLLFVMRRRRRS
jgi:hypothetical protein